MNKKLILKAFIISFIYVFLGTLVVVVSFPEYEILGFSYKHPLWFPLFVLTMPVNISLFGLAVVDFSLLSILTLQGLVLLICWIIVYKILKIIDKYKKD